MQSLRRCRALLVLFAALLACPAARAQSAAPKNAREAKESSPPDRFEGLEFRTIGPFRGGRVMAVSGVRHEPTRSTSGRRAAASGRPPTAGRLAGRLDKDFKTGSIGAIAVSESDPNVVYVGTGEEPVRGDTSHGDGVYKSTDAGKTWKNVGLRDSRHIARVRVHPRNPDLSSSRRRAISGAQRRARHLPLQGRREDMEEDPYVDERPGPRPRDGSLEPAHPLCGVLADGCHPWSLDSGGPGSGLWKSTDGGDTGPNLTRADCPRACGADRRLGLAGRFQPGLRHRRSRTRRPVPYRRCRREPGRTSTTSTNPPARLVLLLVLRRTQEPSRSTCRTPDVPLHRRRQDVFRN